MIKIEKKFWGLDIECESCGSERWEGYEITITLCDICVENKMFWKRLEKNLKERIRRLRKEVEENAQNKGNPRS